MLDKVGGYVIIVAVAIGGVMYEGLSNHVILSTPTSPMHQ